MDLDAGVSLGGRYRLTEALGTGASASVWAAEDEVLGRAVAVKVLSTRPPGDPDFRERFRREARAAARLTHPHIASVFDYGETDVPGRQSVPFIVMELLKGQTLAERIQQGRLEWEEAADICAQLADALAAAHGKGILHRDVKPANIFLSPMGVKVLDFGIATTTWDPSLTLTGGGVVLGTPAYVAPERLSGQAAAEASDVYSLGVLFFEMLVGWPPFLADDWEALASAHRHQDPPSLTWLPGLPDDVELLCRDCMAKDPEQRPSAAEVSERLLVALAQAEGAYAGGEAEEIEADDGRGPSVFARWFSPSAVTSRFGGSPGDGEPEPAGAAVASEPGRRPPLALIATAVSLVAIMIVGYMTQHSSRQVASTSNPPVAQPTTPERTPASTAGGPGAAGDQAPAGD
jgi:serine/threonine protein kinase